jgi:hypothetical protein
MTAWTDIPDSNLEPGKPARSVDALALRDNPVAITERATGAPIVQVPVIEVKTTGTAATWTWPDGVGAATFYIVGGGGGGSSATNNGTDGTDSSITYNSITTTAEGGDGGVYTGSTLNNGGNAGGGDLSIFGETATGLAGGRSHIGHGGGNVAVSGGGGLVPRYGGGGYGIGVQGGCGGEWVRKRVVKVDGLNTVTYTVGGGGAAGAGGGAQAGATGVIIIEY